MPSLDLTRVLQASISGLAIASIAHMGVTRWTRPPAYPMPATSRTTSFGVAMHSFMDTSIGHPPGALDANGDAIPDHGGRLVPDYWQATVHSTFLPGSTEAARYAVNGPERTATYSGPLWVAVFGDMAANRMWEVGSSEWTTQRATLISYATEALAAGRSHMVIGGLWPGLAGATAGNFLDASQKQQLLRQEIEAAVPGLDVFVFPSHLLVQYALASYGSTVYGGDAFHLRLTTDPPGSQVTVALSRMADMALTHEEWDTTGDSAELADLTAEAWRILTTYEFCGMGGTTTVPAAINPAEMQVYIDHQDAPLGTVTSLPARGTLNRTFSEVAFTGGASAVMEADGLELNGHILRNPADSGGPYTRMTILIDVTRNGPPSTSSGSIIEINTQDATRFFGIRYTTAGFQLRGPNAVQIALTPIGGYGDRQVIGGELNLTTGVMTAIEADGETQTAAVATGGVTVNRFEIGKACDVRLHRLAIRLEA